MREIQLTKGYVTQVDDDVYDELNKYNWYVSQGACNRMYARGWIKDVSSNDVLMHRVIMSAIDTPSVDVDHIDGNPLNNQRDNLRVCTRAENLWNTPKRQGTKNKYKGTWYDATKKRWIATILVNGVKYKSKRYRTEEEAAVAYNELVLKHRDQFSYLNVITPHPPRNLSVLAI